jgi:putative membrane protein
MALLASALVGFITALHIYILILEMFLWTTPRGFKSFGLTADFAKQTAVLAANQGLYNGFLALGLAWGLVYPIPEFGQQIQLFFLSCITVAGIFGGVTVKPKIFFIQTVPAVAATLAILFG